MAPKKETREIEEFEVEVTAYLGGDGLDILAELMKLGGEAWGRTETGMGDAMQALIGRMEMVKFSKLAKKLIGKNVFVDGKPMQGETSFDVLFSGRYKMMYKFVAFVLETNFEDFWEDLKRIIATLTESDSSEDQEDQEKNPTGANDSSS